MPRRAGSVAGNVDSTEGTYQTQFAKSLEMKFTEYEEKVARDENKSRKAGGAEGNTGAPSRVSADDGDDDDVVLADPLFLARSEL